MSISERGKAAAAVELSKQLQVRRCAAPHCGLCRRSVRSQSTLSFPRCLSNAASRLSLWTPQERIRLRGCKEEFVANAELLEEGKVRCAVGSCARGLRGYQLCARLGHARVPPNAVPKLAAAAHPALPLALWLRSTSCPRLR